MQKKKKKNVSKIRSGKYSLAWKLYLIHIDSYFALSEIFKICQK